MVREQGGRTQAFAAVIGCRAHHQEMWLLGQRGSNGFNGETGPFHRSACVRVSGNENSFSETCLLLPGCPLRGQTSIGQKLLFQTRLGDFLTLQSALPPKNVALNSP